jgi:glycosyltransferase involved in cell wall biosynthesis
MRIVFLSFTYWPPDFGGELLLSIERLQTLAEHGHSVVALTRRLEGCGPAEQDGGISIMRCPVAGRGFIARAAYVLWTAKVLSRLSFDVLHLGTMPGRRKPTAALAACLYGRIARTKGARTISVFSLAEDDTAVWRLRGIDVLVKPIYYRNIDHIVAVSPELFRVVSQWRPAKSVLITNGVRDDLFTPLSNEERRVVRERFGIPEDGVVFMAIGSAGRRKGYDLLAQAFAALGGKHRKWFLWLVGPMSPAEGCATDERELAEMMAPLRQFEAQVRCFGRINDRSEVRRLIGASDVFVFPTRREGFGVAPVEAMTMGLPVIVSRIPGVTDVACVDQETGLLVPVGDVEALVRAMERLGSDPGLRATLGRKARQRINEGFSWREHIAQWERLYSQGAG